VKGKYANYFEVGHNAFEFLVDFSQFYAEEDEAEPHTRIVTSPLYAKALAEVLNTAIRQYEADYGQIPDPADEADAPPG
jgi:hypothetical protein